MKKKIESFIKQLTDITNTTGIVIDATDGLGLIDDSGWIAVIWYDYESQTYKYKIEK